MPVIRNRDIITVARKLLPKPLSESRTRYSGFKHMYTLCASLSPSVVYTLDLLCGSMHPHVPPIHCGYICTYAIGCPALWVYAPPCATYSLWVYALMQLLVLLCEPTHLRFRSRGISLIPGFEAPKLNFFGPCLIFSLPHFTWHIISLIFCYFP